MLEKESHWQKIFVLTRDMVPIWMPESEARGGCTFVCPLPKGYKRVIEERSFQLNSVAHSIVSDINRQAEITAPPFENILFGYWDRTEEEQKKLLKNFKITKVQIDKQRGVYGVWAGNDVNSGDIYLATDALDWCDMHIFSLKDFFEERTAFCCHNVDYYWQALLTREFCIRYFNWLNREYRNN